MANPGCTYTANNARVKVTLIPAFARLRFSTRLVLLLVIGSPETLTPLKIGRGTTAGNIQSIRRPALRPVTLVTSNSIRSSACPGRTLAFLYARYRQVNRRCVTNRD